MVIFARDAASTLRQHAGSAERGAVVPGLGDGMLLRGDVEDWLAEMARLEAKERAATLRWARIAGWAGIVLVALTVLTTLLGTVLDWALGRLLLSPD